MQRNQVAQEIDALLYMDRNRAIIGVLGNLRRRMEEALRLMQDEGSEIPIIKLSDGALIQSTEFPEASQVRRGPHDVLPH